MNPFNYISGFKDAAGVYHLGARYYDTNLGRFTQQDPTGQEANAYAYAGDNPVNNVDPTGAFGFSFLDKVVAVVGGALAVAGVVVLFVTAPAWVVPALAVGGVLVAGYAIYRAFF